ncbi:hypothetical protein EDD15DRAFT_2201677 [Pisolithus albus]|nr:hypothetical protein EDD15DRAFT_2201677 [Pisolithus albus]
MIEIDVLYLQKKSYVPSVTHGHLIGGWPLAWKTFYEKAALDYVLLPDEVRNTLDNLTPEGRVAVDSAFFEGELSECEDTKGNQPSDGTSLLHYLHKFLNHQLANEYYKTVTKYCKAAKPSMVSATGTSANGQHMEREEQTAGMQLGNPKRKLGVEPLNLWTISKTQSSCPMPSIGHFRSLTLNFMKTYSPQGGGEPEVPSSERREIIFNQKPGPHAVRQDPQLAWVAP